MCEWEDWDWIFENFCLGKDGKFNLVVVLFFIDKLDKIFIGFFIIVIWFWGNEFYEYEYWLSDNFKGNIVE